MLRGVVEKLKHFICYMLSPGVATLIKKLLHRTVELMENAFVVEGIVLGDSC